MNIICCPHCSQPIEIIELNCRIFRCGIFKATFQQIDPHLCKEICEELVKTQRIYGCGKPFCIIDGKDPAGNTILLSRICDYI